MHGIFTNVLWYLEFTAFAIILIGFFFYILYIASIHYVHYSLRYDMRQKIHNIPSKPRPKPRIPEPYQRPVCCDLGCVWFCRLIGSIATIALCYYCAYTLITDTKLKFGLFVP